jgi:DNA-binding transcriptional LysR family regulator
MKWDDRIGRRLKLHDLHILLTVAEMGSMGKAAERLAVSQPSVSKAIADIEHTIGVRLLDRTPKGVETTAYGRALLRRGLGAFDELRQGIKDIESLADPTVGEVRVGCPEAISAGLLSAVIDVFSRRYPQATVSVTPADNMSLEFRRLRDRHVDFLLGRVAEPFSDDDLDAEILYRDRMYFVSSRKSVWGRRRKIDLAELADAPWLLTPSMYGSILAEAFQASGLAVPKVSVGCYSTHQTINLLATSRFVSALSGSQLRFNADRFSLKLMPVDFATRSWPVAIVTLRSRTVSPIVQTFMDCVREVARPMTKGK